MRLEARSVSVATVADTTIVSMGYQRAASRLYPQTSMVTVRAPVPAVLRTPKTASSTVLRVSALFVVDGRISTPSVARLGMPASTAAIPVRINIASPLGQPLRLRRPGHDVSAVPAARRLARPLLLRGRRWLLRLELRSVPQGIRAVERIHGLVQRMAQPQASLIIERRPSRDAPEQRGAHEGQERRVYGLGPLYDLLWHMAGAESVEQGVRVPARGPQHRHPHLFRGRHARFVE